MSAYLAKCRGFVGDVVANPKRSMWLASVVSGVLLVVGGISGLINIFNPLEMVLSAYNMCAAPRAPPCVGSSAARRLNRARALRPVSSAFSSWCPS